VSTTHTDKAYERELSELRDRLLEMGGLVEAAIASSVRAVTERDVELAERVKTKDREINRMEVDVDGACRRILALRQPAASDLRFITTALKIVTDLERMGDLAVNVAERALELAQAPAQSHALSPMHDLAKLADLSEAQLKGALDAFVARDVDKAEAVLHGDELLDALYLKIFNSLLAIMMEDSRNIRRATSIMFAAKYLERFGDHATNLAEMVVYMVRGTDIRHPRSRVPEDAKGT
jgi:phosphate transport system protein